MSLLSHYPVSVLSRTALLISYDKSLQLTLEIIPHFLLPIKPSLSPPPGEELDHKALTLAKNIPRGKQRSRQYLVQLKQAPCHRKAFLVYQVQFRAFLDCPDPPGHDLEDVFLEFMYCLSSEY